MRAPLAECSKGSIGFGKAESTGASSDSSIYVSIFSSSGFAPKNSFFPKTAEGTLNLKIFTQEEAKSPGMLSHIGAF